VWRPGQILALNKTVSGAQCERRATVSGSAAVTVSGEAVEAEAKEKASSALKLLTAEGLLGAGAEILASSTNLVLATSAGNIECTSSVLTGTLSTNKAGHDLGSATKDVSTGGEAEGKCKTTLALGAAAIESSAFPWPFAFTNEGQMIMKGTKKVTFTATFPASAGAKCTFEAITVTSTFTPGKAGAPTAVVVTTASQPFKLAKGSNAACPTEGKLSGTFGVTSAGETVESEL